MISLIITFLSWLLASIFGFELNEAFGKEGHNNDIFLNYDYVHYINNILCLDSISPTLDYDMSRYITLEFWNRTPFFQIQNFQFDTFEAYSDYLSTFVNEQGYKINSLFGPEESHHYFLFSALKKLYVLKIELNDIDNYVIDWATKNLHAGEIQECKDLVMKYPSSISIIDINK